MEKGLLQYNDWAAIVERRAFLLASTNEVSVSEKLINVIVDDNPIVATEKTARRFLEIDNKNVWRWPAGGTMIILNLTDAQIGLTVHKDSGSPSYANHDTIGAGLGSTREEILYPLRTALREGLEEIVILTPDGVVVPILEEDHFGFSLEIESILRDSAKLHNIKSAFFSAPAKYLNLLEEKVIQTSWRGISTNCRALVNFDKAVNGIDLLKVIVVNIPYELKEIAVYDGEVIGGSNLLNRQINAYEMSGNKPTGRIIASWQSGQKMTPKDGIFPNAMVPHTKQIFMALANM